MSCQLDMTRKLALPLCCGVRWLYRYTLMAVCSWDDSFYHAVPRPGGLNDHHNACFVSNLPRELKSSVDIFCS